jgi:ABC-type multidrug transport system fused ATPase/permease subunit
MVWAHSRALTLQIAVLTVLLALLPALAVYLSKLVIDGVLLAIETGETADRDMALTWVAVEAGVIALMLTAQRLQRFLKARLRTELGFSVGQRILAKAERFSLALIEDPKLQQALTLAKQQAASRPFNLISRVFDVAQFSLNLLAVSLLLITFSPWLVLLVAAGGLPLFLADLRYSRIAFRFHTGRTPQMRQRNYLESLITTETAARERLHYRIGGEVRRRFEDMFGSLYQEDLGIQRRHALTGAALGLFSSAVFLGGKLWIVWTAIGRTITLGEMTMLIGLLGRGQNSVTALLGAFNGAVEDLLYISNLYTLLDTEPEAWSGTRTGGPEPGDGLRFDTVRFTYPRREKPALDAVSLHLKPGARIGLIGANGSGKSTLVKLACGLYRPDSGRVLLDGLPLEDWDREALRARISVMFQPVLHYAMSARDNIAAGAGFDAVADDQIERAARDGLADAVLDTLPGRLDAKLSKRFLDGVELSGGQWQRLALARAFLNETADIMILDEPTAAMDPDAEEAFISRPRDHRALILISHRLSNIRHADEIVVLKEGKLIERGDHASLMAQDGAYAAMFRRQAGAYQD